MILQKEILRIGKISFLFLKIYPQRSKNERILQFICKPLVLMIHPFDEQAALRRTFYCFDLPTSLEVTSHYIFVFPLSLEFVTLYIIEEVQVTQNIDNKIEISF